MATSTTQRLNVVELIKTNGNERIQQLDTQIEQRLEELMALYAERTLLSVMQDVLMHPPDVAAIIPRALMSVPNPAAPPVDR